MSKNKRAYAVIVALAAIVSAGGAYLITHKPQPSAAALGKRFVVWFNQQPPASDRILGYANCQNGTGQEAGSIGCIILESRSGLEACEFIVFRIQQSEYIASYRRIDKRYCGGRG